jgi:predicted XRE-type DNA-binding protein
MSEKCEDFTIGSGNVFKDLGLPNPEECLEKSELAHSITQATIKHCLSDEQASAFLGLEVTAFRELIRGRLGNYSVETLQGYLQKLDVPERLSGVCLECQGSGYNIFGGCYCGGGI